MTLGLFDADLSDAHKVEALARVDEHADEAWKADALQVIRELAQERQTFTSDDVWKRLTTSTHEHRAMGAIMRKARVAGWIRPTDRFIPTEKVSQHRQPIRVWRSCLWQL